MIKRISDTLAYIGTDDLDLDLFESQYIVPEGMAYNSYLLTAGKTAIMDTVDARKGEEWLANLDEALGGRTPDFLVVHHMEPDHSALIVSVMQRWPSLVLVASAKAIAMLPQFFEDFPFADRCKAVSEGEVLDLGGHELKFFMAPMVHWPEVMVSLDLETGALFSADAFGKFGALSKCGYTGEEEQDWVCEARRYYFNIVGKYGAPVQSLLKKLPYEAIKAVYPLHGPMLETNLAYYKGLYDTWSKYEAETQGVFIACASIHGGTLAAAEKLAEILKAKGAPKVVLGDLTRSDFAENVEDAFRYPRIVLAASSYDGSVFTPMHNFLHVLQAKGYCKRKVALVENGSWAPSAARTMRAMLAEMKEIDVVEPVVTIRSRLKAADVPALEALADAILA